MTKYYFSEDPLGEFYRAIAEGNSSRLMRVHIPRSEVFYIRAHLEQKFEREFTLREVEQMLYEEGMLKKEDCFEP